jgi:uncharacterized membrane protein YeaQ/YmgE (transglycosylase-associated protein family)
MGLVLLLFFGFVIGLIARALMPGDQRMGIIMTSVLGVGGSFFGGFLGALVSDQRVTDFNTAGVLGSIMGALLLLFVAGSISRRRAFV